MMAKLAPCTCEPEEVNRDTDGSDQGSMSEGRIFFALVTPTDQSGLRACGHVVVHLTELRNDGRIRCRCTCEL
jgi:hypothetical protein